LVLKELTPRGRLFYVLTFLMFGSALACYGIARRLVGL
jgi:hypothetical protein